MESQKDLSSFILDEYEKHFTSFKNNLISEEAFFSVISNKNCRGDVSNILEIGVLDVMNDNEEIREFSMLYEMLNNTNQSNIFEELITNENNEDLIKKCNEEVSLRENLLSFLKTKHVDNSDGDKMIEVDNINNKKSFELTIDYSEPSLKGELKFNKGWKIKLQETADRNLSGLFHTANHGKVPELFYLKSMVNEDKQVESQISRLREWYPIDWDPVSRRVDLMTGYSGEIVIHLHCSNIDIVSIISAYKSGELFSLDEFVRPSPDASLFDWIIALDNFCTPNKLF